MVEQRIPLTGTADPRELKRLLLAAATNGPTAIDDTTEVIHVLRYREIERLLHERRLEGVGLSMFDRMGITDGPLREWYGALMFTNDGTVPRTPAPRMTAWHGGRARDPLLRWDRGVRRPWITKYYSAGGRMIASNRSHFLM